MTVGAPPASPDVPETDGLTRAERRARRDPTSGLPPLEGFELSGPEAERVRRQLVEAGHLPPEADSGDA